MLLNILMDTANIHFPLAHLFQKKRIFEKKPKRGDVIVFKTPADDRTDYIKRLIGLPGDRIRFVDGFLYLNKNKILRKKANFPQQVNCGSYQLEVNSYIESLPNGKSYLTVYNKEDTMINMLKHGHYGPWDLNDGLKEGK